MSTTTTISSITERDDIAHAEDTRLYWIFRNGRQIQRTWHELTAREQAYQREASEREAFNALFAPCGGEQW